MLKAKSEYFKNLDGLRFLCFLSVFTVHTIRSDNAQLNANFYFQKIVGGLLSNGELGVNFFFVLSGFLITYLLIVEKQTTSTINIPNFWFKRVIRIWPLYFACVLFGFVIFPYLKILLGQVPNETADFKLYLLFMGNFNILWNGPPDATELGVLWSIAIEEQFYLIWPIILYLIPVKKYWIVFLSFILVSLTFRAFNDKPLIFYFHTLSCISDMAVGGFGAWLITQLQFKTMIVNLSRFKIIIIYVLFGLVFVFCRQIFDHFLFTRVIERLIVSILMVLIILEQNYSIHSFYKMGNFKGLSKLGLTTYGMYMLHIIGFLIVTTLLKLLKLSDNIYCIIFLAPILGLLITIALSKLSFYYFENRFLKLRKYLKN